MNLGDIREKMNYVQKPSLKSLKFEDIVNQKLPTTIFFPLKKATCPLILISRMNVVIDIRKIPQFIKLDVQKPDLKNPKLEDI
jgi:hypothetical protein